MTERPYTCQYCQTSYTKEKTLAVHLCEQKRRHLQKDERRVQLGYMTFVRFYQISQKLDGTKTYEEFCKSPYYNAFVKFGSFVSNVKPLYPENYIDYVIKSGVKLDHWCREELYEKYVLELILKESMEPAVERSIKNMMEWADNHNADWKDYFRYVSLPRAVYDIKDGKISPWLILNSATGKDMMSKLNNEQLGILYHVLNPEHWSLKFKRHPADVEMIKEIIKEAKL